MIDTVKLTLDVHPSIFIDNKNFDGFSAKYLQRNGSYTKTVLNHAESGEYFPRLTFYKRTKNNSTSYQLCAEFSAPKLLFGNNFEELSDADFEPLILVLQQKLHIVTGYLFTIESLRSASVSTCHFSKNFIFRDYTSCLTVLEALAKQDISGIYDIQITKYRPGHALQIHTNSLDISFYDKIKELQQANISPKRSIEAHSFKQKELLKQLLTHRPFEVFRYEVRLVNRTQIKRLLPDLGVWDFQTLFSSKISQRVLTHYWSIFSKETDLLSLDPLKPMEIFQNFINENPSASTNEALKATASILIVNQTGYRPLQQLISKKGGQHSWYRLKPTIKAPSRHRYKAFQAIAKELELFTPIRLPP